MQSLAMLIFSTIFLLIIWGGVHGHIKLRFGPHAIADTDSEGGDKAIAHGIWGLWCT